MRYASIRSDPPAHLKAIMDAVYAVTEFATHPKTAVAFFFHLPGDGSCFLKRSWFQGVWMLPCCRSFESHDPSHSQNMA